MKDSNLEYSPPKNAGLPLFYRSGIITFFIFLSFFPYVGFIQGIDVQPLFVVPVTLAVLMLKNRKWPNILNLIVLSYIPIFGYLFISVLLGKEDFAFLLSYALCFFVILLFGIFHASFRLDISRVVWGVVFVYVAVAFVQMYVDPYFLAGIKSRSVDMIGLLIDSGRGVSSLASEPSKFAKVLLYCNIFLYVGGVALEERRAARIRIIFISLVLLLLNIWLSRSLHYCAIHFAFVLFIAFGLSKIISIFVLSAFVFMAALLMEHREYLHELGRLGKLLDSFLVDPHSIAEQGAFKRLANPLLSLIVFLDNPFGVGASLHEGKVYYLKIGSLEYPFFFVSRVLGGMVEFLVKFGFLAIFFILNLFFIFYMAAFYEWRRTGSLVAVPFVFIAAFFDGSVVDPYAWSSLFYVYFRMSEISHD